MSTALDDFERELVRASRALHEAAEVTHSPASRNGSVRRSRKLFRRIRQLGLGIQLGLAVMSLSGGLAGYLLLSSANTTSTLASFDCQVGRNTDAIIGAVTGDPAVDCAVEWPSATGGRTAAPPLAVWGSTTGGYAAVARPASWGPPPDSSSWRRLPVGWTVDLRIVALTNQLGDISINPDGPALSIHGCTRVSDAVRAVRGLLDLNRLKSWQVVVRPSAHAAEACESYETTVLASSRTVELTPVPRSQLPHVDNTVMRRLKTLHMRVNTLLSARCATVSSAAALWVREAHLAGFAPTTLAFWRAANAGNVPSPALDFPYHYTLYKQPASQHTGTCAHILVIGGGNDVAEVYAARITP